MFTFDRLIQVLLESIVVCNLHEKKTGAKRLKYALLLAHMLRKAGLIIVICMIAGTTAFASDLFHSMSDQDLAKISLQSKLLDDADDSGITPLQTPITIQAEQSNPLTVKAFPSMLGRNFVGLFSKQNMMPFLAGLAATGAARGLDEEVNEYFSPKNQRTLLSNSGNQFGKPFVLAPAIGTLFVAGLSSNNSKFKAFTYSLAQGYVLDFGVSTGLKTLVNRERPNGANNLSFPSGHAMDSFMIATVIDSHYGHKAGFIAYGVAAAVAASRLERNVHWLSDVAAGATFGYIIGRTVSRNVNGLQLSKHVTVAPAINPFNKEYAFALNIHLP
jgi:PAP2 superfamily